MVTLIAIRQINKIAAAANVFVRIVKFCIKPNEKPPPIMDTGRTSQLARLGFRLRFKLLSISSDPNKIVAHFLDVAGLVFDLVGEWIWPLVVDPAAAGAVGNLDHLFDQVDPILILETNQVLADQRRARTMRDIDAVQVIDKGIQIAIMEIFARWIGDGLKSRIGAILLEFFLHAFDHCNGFLFSTEFCGGGWPRER